MKNLFFGSLPPTTTEEPLPTLYSQFGSRGCSVNLVKDLFSGKCKGFGFFEIEGHEARAAVAEQNGKSSEGTTKSLFRGTNRQKAQGRAPLKSNTMFV